MLENMDYLLDVPIANLVNETNYSITDPTICYTTTHQDLPRTVCGPSPTSDVDVMVVLIMYQSLLPYLKKRSYVVT